ncbi:MAG: ribonuclease P protein component [Bacteroidales bacterium]
MPGFKKYERLTGEKRIDALFAGGASFSSFPFRVVWSVAKREDEGSPVKILFSIPKRIFGKAHDRNLMRRRIREAYRLNKEPLFQLMAIDMEKQLLMAVVFTGKELLDYGQVEPRVIKMIAAMIQQYEKTRE